mgnify:FL=1
MSMIDPSSLRAAFGAYMTGVTVVTARDAHGQAVGFTANSFTSVSLDPPLLLVCPGQFLSSFEVFSGCRHFAVSVLAADQRGVADIFARHKGDRFAAVAHRFDLHDVPVIEGAVARFSCTTAKVIPAGDHVILMGEVRDAARRNSPALGYADGQYFDLAQGELASPVHAETH